MIRFRLAAVLMIALPCVFACETPSSHMAEKFGDSVADAREKMLQERHPPSELEGIEGQTAKNVLENYHHNQEYENRQKAIEDSGLVDLNK
ncbi:MAG: hypothetical protein JRH17_20980 [Deltaproteobacteria bacterium]|nr:hypothetical protein [Deltaproteobacteria bacterium]